MNPQEDTVNKFYEKLGELNVSAPKPFKKAKTASGIFKWIPLTAAMCAMIAAAVLIYPAVINRAETPNNYNGSAGDEYDDGLEMTGTLGDMINDLNLRGNLAISESLYADFPGYDFTSDKHDELLKLLWWLLEDESLVNVGYAGQKDYERYGGMFAPVHVYLKNAEEVEKVWHYIFAVTLNGYLITDILNPPEEFASDRTVVFRSSYFIGKQKAAAYKELFWDLVKEKDDAEVQKITLGEMINNLNLRENMTVTKCVFYNDYGNLVHSAAENFDEILNLLWWLMEDESLENMGSGRYKTDTSLVEVSLKNSAQESIYFATTIDGYLITNILNELDENGNIYYGSSFYIGTEKTAEFEKLCLDLR